MERCMDESTHDELLVEALAKPALIFRPTAVNKEAIRRINDIVISAEPGRPRYEVNAEFRRSVRMNNSGIPGAGL
jgi:hypothetical protein